MWEINELSFSDGVFLAEVEEALIKLRRTEMVHKEIVARVSALCGNKVVRIVRIIPHRANPHPQFEVYDLTVVGKCDWNIGATLLVYPCGTIRIVKDFIEASKIIGVDY